MKRNKKKVYKKLVAMSVGTALLIDAPMSVFASSKTADTAEEDKEVVQESQSTEVETKNDVEKTTEVADEKDAASPVAETTTNTVEENVRANRTIYLGGQGMNGNPSGDGSQQSPFKYIDQACEAAQDGDIIRVVGEAGIRMVQDSETNEALPYTISKSVTIEGTGDARLLWARPIQLGADVTFKNITINIPISGNENNIFAAGYHLTLDNVKTAQNGNRHPYIYGGGYRDHATGDHAQITITNANSETRFAGIYAGTKYSHYDGNVRMDIDERVIIERQGETGAIMEEAGIYASGLKGRLPHGTTTYDYNVNGQVDIIIRGNRFGNSITEINCNTGGTTPKANVELIGVNAANGRLKLYDANNMLLNNTTLKLAPEADMGITGNLTLLEQSILDLSNKTNSYVGGDLIGSNDANTASILELKKDGKMTISGTVTGSTYFITPPIAGSINKNDPISGLVDTGRTYIESNADATGEFLFKPYTSVDEIHKSLAKEQVDGKTTWTIKKEEHVFKSAEISGPKRVTVDDVMQEDEDLAVRFMIKTIDTNDQPFAMDIYARVLDANGDVFNDLDAAYYSFNENTFVQDFMLYPLQATVPTGHYKLQIIEGPNPLGKDTLNILGEYDFEITATLTGNVSIEGNPEVGSTLTANVENLPQGVNEQDLAYQWYVNGVAVQGATSKTWTVAGSANDTVYVEVTHANYANKLQSATTTITNANQLTGTIQIEGTPRAGEILTANVTGLPQGVNEQDLTYQWYVNGAAVQGATAKTWTVVANVGDKVTVKVAHANYRDELTSAEVTVIDKDPITGTVSISGTPRAGETLTADVTGLPQGVNEQDLTYQWYVNDTAVVDATEKTWTVVANVGDKVTVKVAHANYKDELTSAEVTVVDKDPITGTVNITGTPRAGETLTADVTGLPQGVNEQDLTYQWYVNGTAVQGATAKTWTVAANIGDKVTVKVAHANYKDELTSAEVTVVDKDALTGTVTITGTPKVGETLTAEVTGLPNDANVTIKWYANGVEIATGATWTTTYDYVDQEITVKVTADNYTGELTSAAVTLMKADLTGTVTITGTAKVGETLTAEVTGLPNDANTTIKWYANGVEIATGATWTTTYDYVDQEITVKVTADNYAGELTSAAVTLTKQDLTGTVTITGTAKVGETLTAEVTGLPNDANTTIKWYANGVEIATGATWTTTYDYADQEITVKVTADNYAGELTSAAVTLTKQDLTGTVTITGTPQFSETLTASVTQLPADAQNITYKWYVNGVEVQGVNGNTWTPGKEVVGKAITVKVTADNYAGELTSAEVVLQIRDLTGSLTITGGQKPTEELTVDVKDLPADAQNVSYQWYANGTAIPGATSASWTIEEAYVGQSISVQLIADNYTGSLTSNEVVIQPADKTPSVSISGNAVVGSTLQAVLQDVPANAQNISYQWYVDGVAIPGATSDSFVVEEAYAGKSITVKVSFDDLALEIESLKVEIANPENDNVAGDDNTTEGEVPNTGDSTNVFMLLLMAAGALLAKAGIVFKSSKEKE